MLYHTLLLFFRNFKRAKTTFFINLIGLSSGVAAALLITLWVMDEWRFDRYHDNDNRLFQIMEHRTTEGGIETNGHTPEFLAGVLAAELPEIEEAVTVTPPFFFPPFTVSANEKNVEGIGKYVDKDFFHLFSYELIYGNKESVLSDMNSVVLSESIARRLFNDISRCVGQAVEYQLFYLRKTVTVTGIFKDVPGNSSENFDFLLSFDAFRDIMNFKRETLDWDAKPPFFTYIVVKDGINTENLNDKLTQFLQSKTPNATDRRLFMKRFSDNYLYGRYENGFATGRIEYVKLFSVIAVFVLLIACINFINLSTARASRKFKEIGIKKVAGASRKTLAFQYLTESMFMAFMAMVIAILIVDLLLPHFNVITGKSLALLFSFRMIIVCAAFVLVTGVVSGSYPAFMLSALNSVKALTGKITSSNHELWARKGLVVFQFVLSLTFIVCVIVLYRQIDFVQSKNLGYDRDNVVFFGADGKLASDPEAFLNEAKQIPGVVKASSMLGNLISARSDTPGGGTHGIHSWNGRDVVMNVTQVNYDMIETLGIEIKEGRSFSRGHGGGMQQYIYNEAAIDALGIDDPVGKIMPGGIEIVGVAKDFHFKSLHEHIDPHCFLLAPDALSNIFVKIETGKEQETLRSIEALYRKFNPGYKLEFNFLDDSYETLYASEQRVARLSGYSAVLSIVISCLGLFGLAIFAAARRTKEICVRKVLGSSVWGIVYLLSAEFTKIILISVVIALPVSYHISMAWLNTYAYRIPFEWWFFASAGILTLVIGWATVSVQAIAAAVVNPVKYLREE